MTPNAQTPFVYVIAPPEISWTERLRPWREAAQEYAAQASEDPEPATEARSAQCPHDQK